MEIYAVLAIAGANVGYFLLTYSIMKKFCQEEDEEMQKYRRMTGLEIQLLNKKIEEMHGKICHL